jgi:putative nucleotidyltransferase with HDIG domain
LVIFVIFALALVTTMVLQRAERVLQTDIAKVIFVSSNAQETPAATFERRGFATLGVDAVDGAALAGASCVFFDIDLTDLSLLGRVRKLLRIAADPPPVVFAVDGGLSLHHQTTQANAVGAYLTVERPLDRAAIARVLSALRIPPQAAPPLRSRGGPSIAAAHRLIGASFGALIAGAPLAVDQAEAASRALFDGIGQTGLQAWLDTVRQHHAGTFQHCLLVTGAAVAYAGYVGMPEGRRTVLTVAALLHDIGKAGVPNAILDKPGKLTEAEFAVIQTHPGIGADYLARQQHISPVIIDAVRHHHEYLDGSGYPDGLTADAIPELTRILTVCDVYGASIEERAYKAAQTPAQALYVLIGMAQHGKVDFGVVRNLAGALGVKLPEQAV